MSVRHVLGAILLLVIVASATTVSPPDSATNVLSIEASRESSSLSFPSISAPSSTTTTVDGKDLLPPETTTTTAAATTTTTVVTTTTQASSTTTTQASGATTTTTPPTTTTTVAAASGFNAGYESTFFSNINSLRASNGVAILSRHSDLNQEARAWSKLMGQKASLSHSDIGRFLPPWTAAAENVGMGPSVKSIYSAFKSSPTHFANMVGNYTHIGIGVWVDGSGAIWTTHIFTR